MYRHRFTLVFFFFLIGLFPWQAIAQQCDFLSRANDIIPNRVCAPVTADWTITYRGVSPSATTVEIEIDWNDGSAPQIVPATLTNAAIREYEVNVSHIYPKGGNQCLYEPIAYLRVNGTRCTSSGQEQSVTVWDIDSENGGDLVIEPQVYRVCAGTDATVTFQDESDWNCTPPEENDVINNRVRWIQWIYGTLNDTRPRISNIELNTSPTPTIINSPSQLNGQINVLPGPVMASGEVSLPIYVPSTANVGEVFEVTLRNWNQCNPYDADTTNGNYLTPVNGDLVDGDSLPITQTALIVVVEPPTPEFSPRKSSFSGPEKFQFCPDEDVYFKNQTSNTGGGSIAYTWEFFDESGTLVDTKNGRDVKKAFGDPGKYDVVMTALDTDAAGACQAVWTEQIEIIQTPMADMKVIDNSGIELTDLNFCEVPAGFDLTITNETSLPGITPVEYTWQIQKVKPSDSTVTSNLFTTVTTDKTVSVDYTFVQTGLYKITLSARDQSTQCDNVEIKYLSIHNTPDALFQVSASSELCVGREIILEDFSSDFITTISQFEEDTIKEWRWWFDWDPANPATPADVVVDTAGMKNTFSSIKDYDVRLQVATAYGCTDDYILTLTVNPVPNAAFTPVPDDICSGDTVTLKNDVVGTQPASVTVDKYEWIIIDNEDGSIIDQVVQSPTETELDYPLLNTKTDNSPHLYTVYLQAFAVGGCSTLSKPDTITVRSGATAKFNAPAYDPFDSNCSPLPVEFIIDPATIALPFPKQYKWIVADDNGTTIHDSGLTDGSPFNWTFDNPDSISVKEYTVTLEVVPGTPVGCIKPFTRKIKVNPNPSSKFKATVTNQCDLTVVNLDAYQKGLKPSDYEWAISEPFENFPVEDDNFDLQFIRKSIDYDVTITLKTTNFAGCSSTGPATTITIPKLDVFDVDFSIDLSGNCVPAVGEFENISSVPSNSTFELWVGKGGSPAVVVSPTGDLKGNFTYEFDSSGEYTVTLKASNPDGCAGELTLPPITVNPLPKADFNPGPAEVCSGGFINFNENATITDNFNGSTIISREWTITNLTNPGVNEYGPSTDIKTGHQFINSTTGDEVYKIQLKVVTSDGCTDITSRNATVYPEPDLAFNLVENNLCAPYIYQFENKSSNVDAMYIWHWGDGTKDTTYAADPHPAPHSYVNRNGFQGGDTYKVTLEVTGANGCSNISDPVTVNLNPDVSSSFEPDIRKGCAPLTVNFDDFSMDNPVVEWQYKQIWPTVSSYTKFSDNQARATHTFANTTSDSIVYRVLNVATGVGGCSDSSFTDITVYPQVIADFSVPVSESCSPIELTFTNNTVVNGSSGNNVQYVWSWGDGTENDTTWVEATINHLFENGSYTTSRNYTVRLTATDTLTGCEHFMEKKVTIFPSIMAEVSADKKEGCAPLEVQFTNNSLGAAQHEWFYINRTTGKVVEGSQLSTPNAFYTFTNGTEDSIVYDVVYKSLKGVCHDYDTLAITVYPDINASFTASPKKQNLPNSTVTVNNTTLDGSTYQYFWDFGDGTGISDERVPAPYTYENYGTYVISLTVTDQYGKCNDTDIDTVIIEPTVPVVDFEYDPESGCSPLTVQFTNKSKFANKTTYRWDFGDNSNSFSTDEHPAYTYYKPGVYTVSLQASNEIGVTITETKINIIEVFDNPRALFQVRPYTVYLPDEKIFVDNKSLGATRYFWDFGDGTTSEEFEPSHLYDNPGVYDITLVAISENGCTDTLTLESAVIAEAGFVLQVPNAFAPDSHVPSNQQFLPYTEGVVDYNLLIYNRWGELLFESRNKDQGWNGYYKGKLSPQDVYIYKLKLEFINGEEVIKVGDVTLVR